MIEFVLRRTTIPLTTVPVINLTKTRINLGKKLFFTKNNFYSSEESPSCETFNQKTVL